jgi:ABC-2 type transport system ATP-binding protein
MRALSGGMKRRVLVAQALVHKPPVIVLDEPTAGVDVELRQALWDFVKRLNKNGHTVVLTTHYLEEAETLCERIAMLKQGKLVALDTKANLVKRLHNLSLRVQFSGVLPEALRPSLHSSSGDTHFFWLHAYHEVETILRSLREAQCEIVEMELEQPDLEDVFLEIMKREDKK